MSHLPCTYELDDPINPSFPIPLLSKPLSLLNRSAIRTSALARAGGKAFRAGIEPGGHIGQGDAVCAAPNTELDGDTAGDDVIDTDGDMAGDDVIDTDGDMAGDDVVDTVGDMAGDDVVDTDGDTDGCAMHS